MIKKKDNKMTERRKVNVFNRGLNIGQDHKGEEHLKA